MYPQRLQLQITSPAHQLAPTHAPPVQQEVVTMTHGMTGEPSPLESRYIFVDSHYSL